MPLQDLDTLLTGINEFPPSTLKSPEEMGVVEPKMAPQVLENLRPLTDKGSPVERIKGAGKAIWENIGAAQERAGKGLETIVETVKDPSPFQGQNIMDLSRGLLGITGGIGQSVVGTPISAGIGATPEIPAAMQGFKEAYDLLPEETRQKTEATIQAVQDAVPEELKQLIGDALWTTSLGGIPKLAQTAKGAQVGFQEAGRQVKTTVQGVKIKKVTKQIDKMVDDFISSKKSLTSKIDDAARRGTDIKKQLKDPEVFSGLRPEKGKLNVDEAVATLERRLKNALDTKREIIPFADKHLPKVKKDVIRKAAFEKMDKLTPKDQKALVKRINEQVDALPDEMTYKQIDEFRASARISGRDAKDALKPANEFAALENGSRDILFKGIDKLPIDTGGAFANLSQHMKDMITTKKFLEVTAKTQNISSGKMTKLFNKTIGAIAGSGAGPLGSIVGSEIGGIVSNIIQNKQLGNTIKAGMLKKLLKDSPAELKKAQELLKKAQEFKPPQLPAATPGQPRTKIESGKAIKLQKEAPSTIEARELSRVKGKDVQTLIEEAGGWKPGTKNIFDEALISGNAAKVKELLPQVPKEYAERFNAEIKQIISPQASRDDESVLDFIAKILVPTAMASEDRQLPKLPDVIEKTESITPEQIEQVKQLTDQVSEPFKEILNKFIEIWKKLPEGKPDKDFINRIQDHNDRLKEAMGK